MGMDIFVRVCERFRVVFLHISGVVGALWGVCPGFLQVFVFFGRVFLVFWACLLGAV